MSGISFGPVTDYIFTNFVQPAVAGVTINGQAAVAVDGWPGPIVWGMFVLGLSDPPPQIAGRNDGTQMWSVLGGPIVTEDFTVPAYIDIYSGLGTQKGARDEAEGIFNAFWSLLAADRGLGSPSLIPGGVLTIATITSTPMTVGTITEATHRQLISFNLHVTSTHA